MDATLADPLLGALLEQRYRIRGRIARGGMASVYEAVDERLERVVAVKVMHSPYAEDPSFVERFIREARSAAALSHPHVVAVFDQGHDRDVTFLVMEKVDGHTLREVMVERGKIGPAEALSIMEPVLQALAVAHENNLVHRDVKPENVLISTSGMVKVADFGLARAVEAHNKKTTKGVVMGTVAYVSPEQIMSGDTDPRSDVYAAGIVLYEMLTGAAPFVGQSAVNIAFQHVHADVPPPSASQPGIPSALDDLVVRATRRDRDARPADAGVFLRELRQVRQQAGLAPVSLSASSIAGPTQLMSVAPPVSPAPVGNPTSPAAPANQPATLAGTAAVTPPVATPPSVDPPTAVLPTTAANAQAPTNLGRTPPVPAPRQRDGRHAMDQTMPPQPDTQGLFSTGNLFGTGRHALHKNRTGAIMIGAASLLVVAMIVAICGWWVGGDDFVDAPKLVGLSKEDAEAKARQEKLTVEYGDAKFSDTVPRNVVMEQDPSEDGKVEEGGTITLVLSKGPASKTVPTVEGLEQEQAKNLLETNTFKVSITREKNDTIDAGLAIRTDPAAGKPLQRGGAVRLFISEGPPPVPVPDVRGQPEATAREILEGKDFVVEVTKQQVAAPAPGTVISQAPAPGGTAPKGSTVTLTVAEAPPAPTQPQVVTVPDVRGLSYEDAKAQLEALGLRADREGRGRGEVFFQNPMPNMPAKQGDKVRLYLR